MHVFANMSKWWDRRGHARQVLPPNKPFADLTIELFWKSGTRCACIIYRRKCVRKTYIARSTKIDSTELRL